MLTHYVLLAVITYLTQYVQCDGHYTLVGSKEIRPNSDYHVSVTLHDNPEPCSLRVGIKDDKAVVTSQEVTVRPYSTKTMEFHIGDLTSGTTYKLFAEGLTGIIFKNETELNLNEKSFSVLMQTDKATYKPGDLIQFRVLVLDPNMKAAALRGDMKVYIIDGNSNRIKQWPNATTTKGVFSESLQLSEYPVLGDWSINVEVMGETKKKTIEVAEYVLPKFEVIIDTPKHQIYKSGKIMATIRAKYTYGKPVKGEATVTIQPKFYGGYQPVINDLLSRKVIKIDGKGNVEFDMKTDMKITEEYQREFDIEAVVEEELTGRKQSTTFTVTLYQYPYMIKNLNTKSQYKPGLPFTLDLQVVYHDGTPVTDKTNKLSLSYGESWDQKNNTAKEYSLDSNGMVSATLIIPVNDTGIYVQAEYLGLQDSLGYFSMATSVTGQYLQANLKTENPVINKEVSIEVLGTEDLDHFTYQILGRGDVLLSDTVTVDGQKSKVFKFLASFSMVPKAQLIIYYMKDGEIISDKLEIEFRNELQNTITVKTSALQAKPGENIDITVSTRPNSFVGLMGIDQSVLLLKSGNDLSQDEVFEELGQYSQQYYRPYYGRKRRQFIPDSYPSYPAVWDDFNNANAVLLTNAVEPVRTINSITTLSPYENEIFGRHDITTRKKTDIGPAHVFRTNTKPPLAGPYAFSRIPKSKWKRKRVLLDHAIRDAWMFFNVRAGFNGELTLHEKVPDTITSWIITGFSIDPVTGLGLTKSPTKLQVFQPFFVSLNLPYSIKHGEVALIQAVIFNYMEENVVAEVTLHNEDQEFEFVDISNEVEPEKNVEKSRTVRMAIKSNDGVSASFMVKPNKVGPMTVKVTATTPLAGDGIERILPVEPEGVPQYVNKALFIDLRDKNMLESNMTIEIPKNAVPDSTRVSVSVVGDILGITIKNLDSLIRMPFGCGEQNMLNFVPNIVVYKYLKNTNQLTAPVEAKLKKYMESGYQRELTYKHKDNSFSAFGESDTNGSTWLTAFVCRSFNAASDLMDIEPKVIDDGLDWLSKVQADNGSFPEVGNVIHSDMQGGAGHGMALTAYVLIAFLENPGKISNYRNVINKAMDFIVRNQESLDDTYSLALVAYALQLSDHNAKDLMLQKLDQKGTNEGDRRFWSKPIPESEKKSTWYDKPNSVNTEMTAYAMLAELKAGHFTETLPILRWLLAQRNDQGGFQSTQDTCVGLQALAEFAERISSTPSNAQVTVKYNEGTESKINVNRDNAIILQQYQLPSTVRAIDITASGSGFALFSLSYQYNVNVTGEWPRFTLDPKVNKNSSPDYLHLTVCTSFVPAADGNVSNMAVMEIEFPSGFTADLDTIPSLESSQNVQKVETKDGDTKMILYYNNVGINELCPTVDAFRTNKVAKQRPVPVTVYDYYDTTKKARMFYSVGETSLCDICEGDQCKESCSIKAAEQRSGGSFEQHEHHESAASGITATNLLILTAVVTYFVR